MSISVSSSGKTIHFWRKRTKLVETKRDQDLWCVFFSPSSLFQPQRSRLSVKTVRSDLNREKPRCRGDQPEKILLSTLPRNGQQQQQQQQQQQRETWGTSQAAVQTRVKRAEEGYEQRRKEREGEKEKKDKKDRCWGEIIHLKFERKSLSPEAKSPAKERGLVGGGVDKCVCVNNLNMCASDTQSMRLSCTIKFFLPFFKRWRSASGASWLAWCSFVRRSAATINCWNISPASYKTFSFQEKK